MEEKLTVMAWRVTKASTSRIPTKGRGAPVVASRIDW